MLICANNVHEYQHDREIKFSNVSHLITFFLEKTSYHHVRAMYFNLVALDTVKILMDTCFVAERPIASLYLQHSHPVNGAFRILKHISNPYAVHALAGKNAFYENNSDFLPDNNSKNLLFCLRYTRNSPALS